MKCLYVTGLLIFFSVPALADTMSAERPGVMCKTAAALAALTLPDGSARLGNKEIKVAGGCIDIPTGAVVNVQTRRHNTSIVTYSSASGPQTFYVPNIDFSAPGKGAESACLPYDKPLQFEGIITVGKAYGEDLQGKVGWSHWQQLSLSAPICIIGNEARAEDSETNVKAMEYMSDNQAANQLRVGERVTVVGTLNEAPTTAWMTPVFIDIQTVQ